MEYALQITVGALIVMSLVSAITADYLVRFTCPSPGMLRYTKIMLPFEVGGSVFLATLTAAVWSIPAALFFAVGVCLHHYGSLRIIQRNEKATQN